MNILLKHFAEFMIFNLGISFYPCEAWGVDEQVTFVLAAVE